MQRPPAGCRRSDNHQVKCSYKVFHNTPAASYPDQVEESEKARRSERLITHKNRVRDAVLENALVSNLPLIAIAESFDKDGNISAHSESFIEIKFSPSADDGDASALIGKWIKLNPISHKNGILYCEKIDICK